jgi:hypothetical protein
LRERERRESGGIVIDTTFNGDINLNLNFAATKVPRQYPLVLLVNVGLMRIRGLKVEKVER